MDAMRDEEEGAGGVPTVPTTGAQVRAYPLRLFLVHPQAEWSAHKLSIKNEPYAFPAQIGPHFRR